MKKRICFAGFAAEEIESLQPALAEVGNSWQCVFCPDGTAALESLSRDPCAALVVNLRMEGMSGVGLLQLAAGDYPKTLRFALGDITDREAVVSNIGAPHQFIARPWKVQELISLTERSLALDAWLSSDKLRAFVPQLGRLPSLPSTYFEVLKRAESPNATVESIAEIIARDPSLTARILQTVNAAAAAMGEKVTNPADAVAVLGLDTVKSLVLCLQVFNPANAVAPTGISLDDLWRHSFNVAQLCRKIALLHTSDARLASDAFTAGLLHRIGQIVLTTNLAPTYASIVASAKDNHHPLHEVEMKRLGVSSSQIGAYLLGLWGMPLPLIEAAALYHDPERAKSHEFTILTAVHVADALAQEDQPLAEGLPVPKLARSYLKSLGLPDKPDAWRKALAGGQFSAPPEEAKPAPAPRPPKNVKSNDTGAPRPTMGWLALLAAIAAVAIVGWKWYTSPERHHTAAAPGAQTASDTATPAADPAPDAAATTDPATSPLDGIKIQGIIYSAAKPVALINGQPVSPGDKINGVQITAINASNIVVSYKGQQRIIKWK